MSKPLDFGIYFPKVSRKNMSGKVYIKVRIKSDYVRNDGTCAIYLQVRLSGEGKKLPLDINVNPSSFNDVTQRIKGKSKQATDWNIIIEKALAEIHEIELDYRMSNRVLTIKKLVKEFINPIPKFDFLQFMDYELEIQKGFIKQSTYNQQRSSYRKLLRFKKSIPFSDIDDDFIKELKMWLKNVEKNKSQTIFTLLKNFKKYLNIANKRGIKTTMDFREIKVVQSRSLRTFLDKNEIQKLHKYWQSEFINNAHKLVLSKFLFSCFSSLRISDIQRIKRDNIVAEFLVYTSQKTEKINKIRLSQSANLFIQKEGPLFLDMYTDKTINEKLKEIAVVVGIKKRVTFHVARHTFATQFIINGGNVVNLQKLMDHSDIKHTMIYVHIVNQFLDEQVSLLDNILDN